MIPTTFFGGADTQDSLNLSDSRCINLYATTNDDGSIKAFVKTPGLLSYASIPGNAIATGIYTASNGRCFMVASTILYEITTGGSLTSRGTITAPATGNASRMSDNGIEMIVVNGVDAWLFTFATNALKKILVISNGFTVSIATPAVFTKTNHGLTTDDQILLTTTYETIPSDGLLRNVKGVVPTVAAAGGTQPYKLVTSPEGDFIYSLPVAGGAIIDVAGSTLNPFASLGIGQYSRDLTTGVLSPLSPSYAQIINTQVMSNVATYTNTRSRISSFTTNDIVMSPSGDFVYVSFSLVSTGFLVASATVQYVVIFARNVATGVLTYSSLVSHVGSVYNSIVISSDGESAYITNTAANTVSQFSRSTSTGVLTPLSPATIAATAPTKLIISADMTSVYVLGNNIIYMFSRNLTTTLLTALGTPTISTGTNCQGIVISGDGKAVYVTNYGGNSVSQYSRNVTTFALTALTPATIATKINPQDIIISNDGASVYVSNSGSNQISQLIRNETTFLLTNASLATVSTSARPAGLCITADDKSVYVANTNSGTIGKYSREAEIPDVGLPTGIETSTIYYVLATDLTANVFKASLTSGGAAVATSGIQAGTHTFMTVGYGFPEGAKTISYINGRFVVSEEDTQNFYVSNVLSGAIWNPLNVQTADSNPDKVVGHVVSHNELIMFCELSGETYYDSGTYPSPFVRNLAGVFEAGCNAPYSIAKIDNSVMWLGKSTTGQGVIYRLNGYTPTRISTYSIEAAMQQMTTVADARAFTYQQSGHHFYLITFPTGDKTFVYDVNTNLWHERADFINGAFTRWEAQEYAFFDGKHLVCYYREGKIYSIDIDTYKYGVDPIKWVRSFRVPTNSMDRIIHRELSLEAEMGVGQVGQDTPTVMLKYSNDGGHTWSPESFRELGIGAVGEYAKRVRWHKLGITSGQPRIYELSGTANAKTVLLNAFLK